MSDSNDQGGYGGFVLLNPEVAPLDAELVDDKCFCACGAPIKEEDDGVCDLCAMEYMQEQQEAAAIEAELDELIDWA